MSMMMTVKKIDELKRDIGQVESTLYCLRFRAESKEQDSQRMAHMIDAYDYLVQAGKTMDAAKSVK